MAAKSKRWSQAETLYLLRTLEELGIIQRTDGRKFKNAELYKSVAAKMKEVGYQDRDAVQVANKWKLLKQEYNKAKAKNKTSGSDPSNYPYFEEMDRVLGGRPMATADTHGIDAGFEAETENDGGSILDDGNSSLSSETADGSPGSGSILSDQAEEERPSSTDQAGEEAGDAASAQDATNTPHKQSRKKTPKPKSGFQRTVQTWSAEQRTMMEEMQAREQAWAEQQQERRDQRERLMQQQRDLQEENFIARIMEQNTRSTERLVGMMFEGLRTLLGPAQPGPPAPQYHSYPHYNYPVPQQRNYSQHQNFPTQPRYQHTDIPQHSPNENPGAESESTFQQLE